MSSVPHVSSNSGYSSNPSISSNSNKSNSVSAFFYLAEAMNSTLESAKQVFGSQSALEKEKQAILRELQSISSYKQRQDALKFLISSLSKTGNTELITWLKGLNDQIQDTINQIWKMFHDLLKKVEKDDDNEHQYYGLKGFEWDNKLSRQRVHLINVLRKLLKNPDDVISNFSQIANNFEKLAKVIQKEQTDQRDNPFNIAATWFQNHVVSKLNKDIKDLFGTKSLFSVFKLIGLSIADAVMYGIEGILKIPVMIEDVPQKGIISDSQNALKKGESDLQIAQSISPVLRGQYEIDVNNVSSLIEKDSQAISNFNNIVENPLKSDSELIAKVNYNSKV